MSRSLMIALPCYGGLVTDKTTSSLFNLGKLLARNKIYHGLLTVANESNISLGRSKIANFFINNTTYDYCFFLDADIGFNPEDVLKLLDSPYKITCGTYPMKALPIRHCVNLASPIEEKNEYIKINGAGFGFCMIHRSVFVDISNKFSELQYTPENNTSAQQISAEEMKNSFHFFAEYKENNMYLSEDKSFLKRAIMCGHSVWLDRSIKLSHTGSHVFKDGDE